MTESTKLLGLDGQPLLPRNVIKVYRSQIEVKSDVKRHVLAAVSTDAIDRDGEVVVPRGIDKTHFQKNPVVLWAHDYRTMPIGKALWTKRTDDGRRFLALTQFNHSPLGEAIFRLYQSGDLNAFSIGFQVLDWSAPTEKEIKERPELETCKYMLRKTSLLEYSAVPVPANPEALVMEVSKGASPAETIVRQAVIDHKKWLDLNPISVNVPITLIAKDSSENNVDLNSDPEPIEPAEDHDTVDNTPETEKAVEMDTEDKTTKMHIEDIARGIKELKKGLDEHKETTQKSVKDINDKIDDLYSKHHDSTAAVTHHVPADIGNTSPENQGHSPHVLTNDDKSAEDTTLKMHVEDMVRCLKEIKCGLEDHKCYTEKCFKEMKDGMDELSAKHEDLRDQLDKLKPSPKSADVPTNLPFKTRSEVQKDLLAKASSVNLGEYAMKAAQRKIDTLKGKITTD